MDPTTLITFTFRAPSEVSTVELLGSWDNFVHPYRMRNDRRRGIGFWSGCFKFENIMFDGNDVQWSKPRCGGLKQGGTYWYYFRINYDFDAFDHRQPNTTACPLLPGQAVNIVEVPYELMAPPERSQSAHGYAISGLAQLPDHVHTMEPGAKYAMLEPPAVSKLHSRCLSDEALDGRLEGQNQPHVLCETPVSPGLESQTWLPPQESTNSKLDDHAVQGYISSSTSAYCPQDALPRPEDVLGATKFPSHTVVQEATGLPSKYSNNLELGRLGSVEALTQALLASPEFMDHQIPSHPHSPAPTPEIFKPAKKRSEISIGPMSVHNVQFYGSRPGTSLTEDPQQHRPRIYSLPSVGLRDCLHGEESSPLSMPYFDQSRHEILLPHGDLPLGNTGDVMNELASPTFSAATVSSQGENTPSSLSTRQSSNGSTETSPNILPAVENYQLFVTGPEPMYTQGFDSDTSQAPPHHLGQPRFAPHTFMNYSLPTMASLESNSSLAKTLSNHSGHQGSPLPSVSVEGQGRSLAEDIFSELGF